MCVSSNCARCLQPLYRAYDPVRESSPADRKRKGGKPPQHRSPHKANGRTRDTWSFSVKRPRCASLTRATLARFMRLQLGRCNSKGRE